VAEGTRQAPGAALGEQPGAAATGGNEPGGNLEVT
jgi:hypothetical protein